jgi:hypothetical protein
MRCAGSACTTGALVVAAYDLSFRSGWWGVTDVVLLCESVCVRFLLICVFSG